MRAGGRRGRDVVSIASPTGFCVREQAKHGRVGGARDVRESNMRDGHAQKFLGEVCVGRRVWAGASDTRVIIACDDLEAAIPVK